MIPEQEALGLNALNFTGTSMCKRDRTLHSHSLLLIFVRKYRTRGALHEFYQRQSF